jgi:hypothetical protein
MSLLTRIDFLGLNGADFPYLRYGIEFFPHTPQVGYVWELQKLRIAHSVVTWFKNPAYSGTLALPPPVPATTIGMGVPRGYGYWRVHLDNTYGTPIIDLEVRNADQMASNQTVDVTGTVSPGQNLIASASMFADTVDTPNWLRVPVFSEEVVATPGRPTTLELYGVVRAIPRRQLPRPATP